MKNLVYMFYIEVSRMKLRLIFIFLILITF